MNPKIIDPIDPRNPGTAENKQLLITLFLQTEKQEPYWIANTSYVITYKEESYDVQLAADMVHYPSENFLGNRYSVLGEKLGQGAFCEGVYLLDKTYRIKGLEEGNTEQYELEERVKRDDNKRVAKILSLIAPANARRMLTIKELKQEAKKEYKISQFLDYFHMKKPVILSGDKVLLVMHYIPGRDLQAIINADRDASSRLSVQQLFYISLGLIDAMEIMSKNMIIYNDAKPENFMVDLNNIINNRASTRLVDIGLAQHELNKKCSAGGSYPFASPEGLAGKQTTFLSDMFSFGRVLLLFWRIAGGANFLWARQNQFDTLFTDTSLKRDTKKIVSSIIRQMLSYDPEDRPQSLDPVREAFEKGLRIEEGQVEQKKSSSYISPHSADKLKFWKGGKLHKSSSTLSLNEIKR